MLQRRSNIQTLSCSCPAPRSCSIARRRLPPSISSCRKEILVSPSGRWIRDRVTSACPSHRRLDNIVTPFWVAPTSRPSDCSSYSYCRGPFALTNVALYRKVGSRCSIRTTPLCTAAAPGLRVLACRFSVHSPEKSGFCCATPKPASPRRITLAIHVRINIRALLNRGSFSHLTVTYDIVHWTSQHLTFYDPARRQCTATRGRKTTDIHS